MKYSGALPQLSSLSMLSDSSHNRVESFQEHQSRNRRLADVKRGAAYTRTVDSLADRHWHAHGGLPVLVTATSPTRDRRPRPDSPVSTSLPSVISSQSMFIPGCETEEYVYNTWGSRNYSWDRKLEPETRPTVIQPKRGVMMSRVARHGQDRPSKTMTNFRSRNGLIRIIEPVNAQPSFHRENREYDTNFDPTNLEREQTYVMLKRIDQILHPSKMYFKSELSSSEIEILSNESTEQEDKYKHSSLQPPQSTVRRYPNNPLNCEHSLALVVSRLAKVELNAYQKCQIWINRCPAM